MGKIKNKKKKPDSADVNLSARCFLRKRFVPKRGREAASDPRWRPGSAPGRGHSAEVPPRTRASRLDSTRRRARRPRPVGARPPRTPRALRTGPFSLCADSARASLRLSAKRSHPTPRHLLSGPQALPGHPHPSSVPYLLALLVFCVHSSQWSAVPLKHDSFLRSSGHTVPCRPRACCRVKRKPRSIVVPTLPRSWNNAWHTVGALKDEL